MLEKHLVGSMYYQLSLIIHSLLNVDGTFGAFNIKPGVLDFTGRFYKLFTQDYYEIFHKELIQKYYKYQKKCQHWTSRSKNIRKFILY